MKKKYANPPVAKPTPDWFKEIDFGKSTPVTIGEPVQAKVVASDSDSLYLELGPRQEGVLSRIELTAGEAIPKEGDTMTVVVTGRRNGIFQCTRRLGSPSAESGRPPRIVAAVRQIQAALQAGLPVQGRVSEPTRGGFSVSVLGLRAFCPASQMDDRPGRPPEEHAGQTYDFLILECDEEGRNVIVSRRKLLTQESRRRAESRWGELAVGQSCEGTVTTVMPYGAFIDIGGVEGLLHVSEISHQRVSDPSSVLHPGDKMTVAIKDLDRENHKIALSLKSLQPGPWDSAGDLLVPGREIIGRVVSIKPYGAFIEVIPGIEGLLHVSRMGGERTIRHPKEMLHVGDPVTVRILEVDTTKKTVSLTMEGEINDYTRDLDALRRDNDRHSGGGMNDLFSDLEDKK